MSPPTTHNPKSKLQPSVNGHQNGSVVRKSLSQSDKQELAHCEATIQHHLDSFLEVGRALTIIQKGKLYRAEYGTFEEYCRARWGMGRHYAYRQIQAAEVVQELATNCQQPLPESESQARALVGLTPEAAKAVWTTALKEKNGRKPSSQKVAQVRQHIVGSRNNQRDAEIESWRLQTLKELTKLKQILKGGSQAEARAIALRITLLLDVGTYGSTDLGGDEKVGI